MSTLQHNLDLPEPSADLVAHSKRVKDFIRRVIGQSGGEISFCRFMELALYAPNLGYYSAGNQKLGAGGDFITAPEISSLFSFSLAKQIAQILQQSGGDVVEFGAGSGVMAADMLLELEQLKQLPEHYYIIEVSADLRQRQQDTITKKAPALRERVKWLDELPREISGVVVANELLDAMPVHRFVIRDGEPYEVMVVWDEQSQQFQTTDKPISEPRLRSEIEQLQLKDEGYSSEINLNAIDWIVSIGERLQSGAILLIDYGYSRHDYYHPRRSDGTLLCHYQHRAHPNPLILPGIQDITAHVDFTAIADTALDVGLHVHGYANQSNFLLGCGITDYLSQMVQFGAGDDERDMTQQIEVTNQLKKLTMPDEMGESFKVIALSRGIDIPLLGFSIRDDRNRL
ncbi:MAG: SAM-dependent methyltransferase [Gammaproteobacteria bacterium]|nr:SAM-dependent methyltransferase [Gammaproteobacteria bacterium]